MKESGFDTPVLLVVFNRPDTTRRVFEEIRKQKPTSLFIAADGPRQNRSDDIEKCCEVRKIVSNIDWSCDVKTLFRETNLGCKYGVSSAINWFFDNIEEGIILEDDDLPDKSFFPFCRELLKKYKDDQRVMHISGNNFQQNNKHFKPQGDYYFSSIPHIWGWATWRRAWKSYDVEAKQWPAMKKSGMLGKIFSDNAVAFFWSNSFQRYYDKKINSYDGQWALACLYKHGLSVTPTVNLVSNIGFGNDATHTSNQTEHSNLPTQSVSFPLKHPSKIKADYTADNYTFKYVFEINRYLDQRVKWFLKSNFTKPYMFLKKLYYKILLRKVLGENKDPLTF